MTLSYLDNLPDDDELYLETEQDEPQDDLEPEADPEQPSEEEAPEEAPVKKGNPAIPLRQAREELKQTKAELEASRENQRRLEALLESLASGQQQQVQQRQPSQQEIEDYNLSLLEEFHKNPSATLNYLVQQQVQQQMQPFIPDAKSARIMRLMQQDASLQEVMQVSAYADLINAVDLPNLDGAIAFAKRSYQELKQALGPQQQPVKHVNPNKDRATGIIGSKKPPAQTTPDDIPAYFDEQERKLGPKKYGEWLLSPQAGELLLKYEKANQ